MIMARILIIYGTTEGHTRKVAEYIANVVRREGHSVDIADSSLYKTPLDKSKVDAVIIGASVHQDKHQASVTHFVKDNQRALAQLPTAFLSVSLIAAEPDEEAQTEARQYISDFLLETAWQPQRSLSVAGALLYTKHDFLKRLLRRYINKRLGREADSLGDQEYTDWEELKRFATDFIKQVVEPRLAAHEAVL